jgi:hypothetical protein
MGPGGNSLHLQHLPTVLVFNNWVVFVLQVVKLYPLSKTYTAQKCLVLYKNWKE